MKRCPFCAEEIMDEAIKCRFCGEWLSKGTQPDNIETATPEDSKVKKDSEAITIEEVSEKRKEEEPAGNVQKKEEVPVRPLKEKFPWGWGWLILIAFYSMAFKNMKLRGSTDEFLGFQIGLEGLGFVLLLLMYYWLRRKLLRKKHYADISRASFISGLISYVVIVVLIVLSLGLVQRFDNRAALKRFETTQEEAKKTAMQWNQEEANLWERINLSPNTVQGNAEIVNIMKKILSITEQRKALMDRYFAEARFIYKDSKDVALINNIQDFKKLTYEVFDKYRKGIESYIEYFSTGDKGKEEIASKLLLEVNSLSEKAASLAAQVLNK